MSIKISDVVSWRLNPETGCIELIVNLPMTLVGSGIVSSSNQPVELNISSTIALPQMQFTQAIVEVPETKFAEIIDLIPALEDSKKLKDLLDTLFRVRKERLLTIEELSKECEAMTKKHEDLQERLKSCSDKVTLFALTAESKDLGTEKVIIDTKRHLIGLLIREEGKIRADIAKQQSVKDRE